MHFDTKFGVWVAHIKTQLVIATHVGFLPSLFWLIDSKLCVWVVYLMTQLKIATQVSMIKVKATINNTNSGSAQ
jgi:hypothetical protein